LVHAEDWDLAVERSSEWVTDAQAVAFADEFCLFGSAESIVARLRLAQDAGATAVFLQHVGSYDLPHRLMRDFATEVMPLLKAG
jgi:5,10-methylenetetrahydromethanopterin reductase